MTDPTPAEKAAIDAWCRICQGDVSAIADVAVDVARPGIAAETLRAFADAHRFPADWVMFRRGDGSGVTVGELLRETAARLERPESEAAAVDAMRDRWAEASEPVRRELSQDVHDACDGVWNRNRRDRPCCEFHNIHCEPPSELCCYRCTEARHPEHPAGIRCVLEQEVDRA